MIHERIAAPTDHPETRPLLENLTADNKPAQEHKSSPRGCVIQRFCWHHPWFTSKIMDSATICNDIDIAGWSHL